MLAPPLAVLIFLALMSSAAAYADPPARFDHPNKNAIVKWASREEVWRICHHGSEIPVGCALLPPHGGKPCLVLVTHTWDDARLLRHEIAHCNGWPANHPP
jgi:hypothetical protein